MGFLRQVRSTTAQEAKAKKHNKQGPSHSQGQFGNVLPDGKKQVLEQEPEDNAPDSTLPRNQAMVQCSAEADNPIGRINEIMASILRRPLSKEDVQYTFSEHDSTFTCAVTIASDGLLLEASGEPATTKRQAKSNAANALLLSKELETFLAELSREAPDPAMQGRRTIDSATGVQPQPWSEEVLHRLLRELLQRNPNQDDIIYTFEELDEGVVCSMRLPVLERLPACKGKPAPSRKKAKQLAADELVSCILSS
mmetsp:Transcript_20871/g.48861  ORF Transcript_20871/g.48861 Transcript_20871/m.48861 type:complete len:253 (-) Transcript_20871:24-782(-)